MFSLPPKSITYFGQWGSPEYEKAFFFVSAIKRTAPGFESRPLNSGGRAGWCPDLNSAATHELGAFFLALALQTPANADSETFRPSPNSCLFVFWLLFICMYAKS